MFQNVLGSQAHRFNGNAHINRYQFQIGIVTKIPGQFSDCFFIIPSHIQPSGKRVDDFQFVNLLPVAHVFAIKDFAINL